MTELELIKDFGRDTVFLNRALVGISRRAASDPEGKSWVHFPDAKLLVGPSQAAAYYNFTEALSRHMPIDLALDAWRDTLERLREMLGDWGHVAEGVDVVDTIADRHRRLLADLVEKAEAECRAHEETLHLLDSPANAKRLVEAIAEADSGLAREMTPEQLRAARGPQD
jgi:hypothetical protein